ncbi:MAG: hypothetical protein EOO42_23170 [Flavobacteriales bacterium]|nr:MAG: hypothetical protein EOO42_23170 [Flavobacteriales bacterium]
MRNTNRFLFLALVIALLSACGTRYTLVKSNREEYNINTNLAVDSTIIKTYLPYKAELDREMNDVIGYTDVTLTKSSKLPESVLGNFFADAVLNQARKIEPNIDFAIPTTNGGLRNDIAKGEITVSKVFELMPFENETVVFTLKGRDVLDVLNFIASSGGQPVSGLKMKIENKLPKDIFINGKAFDLNKTYVVLTSDYIASGGDGTTGFSKPIAKKVIGLKVRDALLQEIKQLNANGKRINTTLDGRVTKD